MSLEEMLKGIGLDRYDRTARIGPALFALLPAGALVAVWLPGLSKAVAGAGALLLVCGVAYFLKGYARTRGHRVEERILERLGAWPSTLALRHGGPLLDEFTRDAYHAVLRAKGQPIPTADEQARDPARADAMFERARKWLLEQTRRADHPSDRLLFEENIDYGFRKNLVGLKPFAVGLLVGCLLLDLAILAVSLNPTNANISAGAILAAVYLIGLLVWATVLTDDFVEKASWKYTTRLLASLDTL